MSTYRILKYIARIGIALSVLLNVTMGGYSNQTFSARNWSWYREGKWNLVWFIDGVCDYLIQPVINLLLTYVFRSNIRVNMSNHCMTSWVYWRLRKDVIHEHYSEAIKKVENENG